MSETLSQPTFSSPSTQPLITQVKIRNYKSVGKCDVSLAPLTILVGRNGSGKSNFLDALRFIVDGLQSSLESAIRLRSGIDEVRRRSTGHPRNFAIELEMVLPTTWQVATYGFEIGARRAGGFTVKQERLRIRNASGSLVADYTVTEGTVVQSAEETMPPAVADRLYLVNAAGLPRFRPVYDALLSMGFYSLNPAAMKELQTPDTGELLRRDGANIASVIARLEADEPALKERIKSYLATIVPGITEVDRVALGHKETLQFRQKVVGSPHPWKFYASSMSDGTLRALGTLVAVTQLSAKRKPVSLVGIEEPETALHPAAAGSLMNALREAASHTQILVTTHSPELLDEINLQSDQLLVVQSREGTSEIAAADSASVEAIQTHLYTAGELLRMDQLSVDERDIQRQRQLRLFGDEGEDEE